MAATIDNDNYGYGEEYTYSENYDQNVVTYTKPSPQNVPQYTTDLSKSICEKNDFGYGNSSKNAQDEQKPEINKTGISRNFSNEIVKNVNGTKADETIMKERLGCEPQLSRFIEMRKIISQLLPNTQHAPKTKQETRELAKSIYLQASEILNSGLEVSVLRTEGIWSSDLVSEEISVPEPLVFTRVPPVKIISLEEDVNYLQTLELTEEYFSTLEDEFEVLEVDDYQPSVSPQPSFWSRMTSYVSL